MNLMIATVGVDPGWLASSGGSGSALCVAIFAVAGLLFLFAGACVLLRCRESRTLHIDAPHS